MPLTILSNLTKKFRNRHFVLIDVAVVLITPFLALLIRFDGRIDFDAYMPQLLHIVLIGAAIKISVFFSLGLYNQLWRSASIDEMAKVLFAGIFSILVTIYVYQILGYFGYELADKFPLSFPLIDGVLTIFFVALSRFSIRLMERANQRVRSQRAVENIAVVGAGQAGIMVCQELFRHPEKGRVTVFLDDDKTKHGLKILGVPVVGSVSKLESIIHEKNIHKVIVAIPTAPGHVIREVSSKAIHAGLEVMTVPAINEILNGKVTFEQIRKVQVEDLLRREPIETDTGKVKAFLKGKRVLVTGAGGSIGSELCRQIASFDPKELILLGHGENSIFEIEQELLSKLKNRRIFSSTRIISKIADIRFKDSLRLVFQELRPEIVFHAAAHKHVPLMENNPSEAISNNVLGTKNLVDLSVEYNVEGFIMISTDKAVNPTNIMGTSKRIAEMVTLNAAKEYKRRFSAVRFGNVLGSRGSVLHTFRKQVTSGGPITITHPDIIRYFMTIPEAVQLVLQSSVLSNGGEVFLLDMGEPVKIIDLARDYIKFSGLKEGIDIDIEITGLRPGEKLFEELFVKGETYIKTEHEKVLIANNASNVIPHSIEDSVLNLIEESKKNDGEKIYYLLKTIVPEFNPANLQKIYSSTC